MAPAWYVINFRLACCGQPSNYDFGVIIVYIRLSCPSTVTISPPPPPPPREKRKALVIGSIRFTNLSLSPSFFFLKKLYTFGVEITRLQIRITSKLIQDVTYFIWELLRFLRAWMWREKKEGSGGPVEEADGHETGVIGEIIARGCSTFLFSRS